MATTSIYVQLRGGRPPRIITATSLAWVFGRATTVTALYSSTAGTAVAIETFIHRQESTPEPSAGSFTVVPTTDPKKTITVAQEQVALETPLDTAGAALPLAPAVINISAEATTASTSAGRNFKAPGRLTRILNETHYDYIRFTGTELPTGGIIIPRSEIVAMFTSTPAPTDL